MTDADKSELLDMTVEVVSSFVSNNEMVSEDLPALIKDVYQTFSELSDGPAVVSETQDPAVSIAKSITPDYLICLEDGRKLKMLKRYLRSKYDMTPEDYRTKWNLPADYPMVAPNYAKLRSKHAKQIGLGKKTPDKK